MSSYAHMLHGAEPPAPTMWNMYTYVTARYTGSRPSTAAPPQQYPAYHGGAPKYRKIATRIAAEGYRDVTFD